MSKDKSAKIPTPQAVRGTQDMLGDFADRFAHVVETFERVRRLYGYKRIEVPVIEPTAVFARSLGETTDVVSKEMYSFDDRGGESITLRPEFTAGIARAYVTNGWQQFAPLKVATHGPLFRYERPQKGRYRQFHQLDAEVLGSDSPLADAELLVFADQLLKELGINEGVTLTLNTLGDAASRDGWRAALVEHFEAHRGDLSEDSLARLDKNPLRILDSKDPKDRPIADSAPDIDAFLTSEAQNFFGAVTAGLDAAGVAWERNARLVRGLDYYRHTAFEFVTDRLGAQGTVLGGGRYDGLIENLGGPPTPAVGWAAGIERLAMLLADDVIDTRLDAVIAVEDDAELAFATKALAALRAGGFSSEIVATGSPRKRFDKAAKIPARALISVGVRDGQRFTRSKTDGSEIAARVDAFFLSIA
ncbi:histidyl-tRNA synthetase [Sphingopyxis sp. H038]|uniref:histidine--tRNA ligase n=1 Tax=unclassified Sphingopyxis TaxID=2614943 RepID=UPI0007317801|nr:MULTISPECIES: histidine--tRNA ligase [unclassified Sphingopyxis]KTE03849.1 histidyl-tRNA synthetase [Sphingopyxis sp. H012]KTE06327.1 histidyl-tRNA synthetase [Sphingopyxis sp. H093]KTE09313.1 histidyl-tRNA synthetase [Sphingopyxis sp. H053]KTE27632.1 histidyl-tRNA synthetase [Sphingopyxis sp. H080]KTE35179.1 histidyl-tRNA synthetase [Sphingopyxis sp. H038]